jgi:hypothetical protein
MSQGCPLYRNGIPSQSTKQETEIKDIWTLKEEAKLSLFIDYVILNLKDPKVSPKISHIWQILSVM